MRQDLETKIKGKNLFYNIGNRVYGATIVGFFGFMSSKIDNPILDCACYLAIAEGIGDLITGQHHYLSSKLLSKLKLFKS